MRDIEIFYKYHLEVEWCEMWVPQRDRVIDGGRSDRLKWVEGGRVISETRKWMEVCLRENRGLSARLRSCEVVVGGSWLRCKGARTDDCCWWWPVGDEKKQRWKGQWVTSQLLNRVFYVIVGVFDSSYLNFDV